MNSMLCHLLFPYAWEECQESHECIKAAHVEDSPENLNSYPHAWVKALLGCSTLNEKEVCWEGANGMLHRTGGPALERSDGSVKWFFHGKLHREDGPAVFDGPDVYSWWRHGKLHRDGGPAETFTSGEEWWCDGKLHRVDGPAIIWANGAEMWYLNGKRHRVDGPAVTSNAGEQEWWINGVRSETVYIPTEGRIQLLSS